MSKARFNERIIGVVAEAARRLTYRMKRAYFRGELPEYLERIGLAKELPEEISEGDFKYIHKQAQSVLERNIRQAVRNGYLKDYLSRVNMMDILLSKRRIRTVHLWAVPNSSEGAAKEKISDGNDYLKPILRVVK